MSYDDKEFMSRGLRVRHKYKHRRGGYPVCERCGVKRRATSSGWEYFDPRRQPKPVDGSKVKPYWSSSNPPCVKRDETESEPFPAKAELAQDDLNVLSFFFHFVGPLADRAAAGLETPEIARYPDFVENWRKFSNILDRLYKSTGATEYFERLTVAQRKAIGKKVGRLMIEKRT